MKARNELYLFCIYFAVDSTVNDKHIMNMCLTNNKIDLCLHLVIIKHMGYENNKRF